MMSTDNDWRIQVKKGDVLELGTTYETKMASWYESMGINVVYMADNETGGKDPYVTKVDTPGVLNHGHYDENNDHGGTTPLVGPDPATLPNGIAASGVFQLIAQNGDRLKEKEKDKKPHCSSTVHTNLPVSKVKQSCVFTAFEMFINVRVADEERSTFV